MLVSRVRLAWLLPLSLLAACGGGDDAADTSTGAPSESTLAPAGTAGSGDADPASDDAPPDSDGTARLEVDGVTLDARASRCLMSDTTIRLTATGDLAGSPAEIVVDGSGSGGAWIIQAQVLDDSGAVIYQSSNTSTAEVAGSTVEMTGEWVWNDAEGDLDGGPGTLTATCS